jgi:hypothetical protein
MKWIQLGESYTWMVDFSNPEETAYRYDDGMTLREKFPRHYKLIPDELCIRLTNARDELRSVLREIDGI